MNQLCPKCRGIKEMRIELKELKEKNSNGKDQKTVIKNYYCTACDIFVKSEEEAIVQ